jgi:hypothetical protein
MLHTMGWSVLVRHTTLRLTWFRAARRSMWHQVNVTYSVTHQVSQAYSTYHPVIPTTTTMMMMMMMMAMMVMMVVMTM